MKAMRFRKKYVRWPFYFAFAIYSVNLFFTSSFNFEIHDTTYSFKETVPLKSECPCHSQTVDIRPIIGDVFRIHVNDSLNAEKNVYYDIPTKTFEQLELTCDLYKVLKRGKHQRVIGFSLYGKKHIYERYLTDNAKAAKEFYPDWTIRIYHDDTINKSIVCDLECKRDPITGVLLNNVDFCDVTKIPIDFKISYDRSYMWPMTWRWLPIGDHFVDMFISRDTDSTIFDREVVAVKEWLKTNTIFHIMRDNPAHAADGYYMLGGMWGIKTRFDKTLSKYLYKVITSRLITAWYSLYTGEKGHDQYILNWYFWPHVKANSTIHDSYTCQKFGGKAFPSQRPPYEECFVGAMGSCKKKHSSYKLVCPIECRPQEHPDWIYC